ncbi:MAG TPA: hypothetical protein VMI54_14865 [Polyangiaceae bacterium]|nr:hypothetical protein [Polyangiaceae bacterium]
MTLEDGELRQLLLEHFEDLEELEILARFHERGPGMWNEAEVAAMTQFPLASTREALRRLAARGLLEPGATAPPVYRLSMPDAAIHEALTGVIAVYRSEPLKVIGIMTTHAIQKVRTAAITTFAECFRIGGPKSHG